MSDSSRYFNPIPLFILFREAIEASIVVAVLLTFLQRSSPKLKKHVWWGVGIGIGISLILAAVFAILFYVAQNNAFTGTNLIIFKGTISWVACIFITYLAFAMLRYEGWERKWERKLAAQGVKKMVEAEADADVAAAEEGVEEGRGADASINGGKKGKPLVAAELGDDATPQKTYSASAVAGLDPSDLPPNPPRSLWARARHSTLAFMSRYTLFFVVFFTVLREGLESVIFLFGVGNAAPESIPISGLIGIACGVCVGVVLYYTGRTVKDIKWLLWILATLLFFIAAGSCQLGAEALMQVGMFGPFVLPPTAYTAPGVGAVSSRLFGGEGQPPAPSAAGGGAAASAFNDGDEIVVIGPLNLNDGYTYVMTPRQPWWQEPLWDISACCGDTDEQNKFFSLIKPIFGYKAQPCFIDAIFYMGYWFVVLSIGLYKWHKGTLTDADWKYTRMMKEQREQEAIEAALAAKTADTWRGPDVSLVPFGTPSGASETKVKGIQLAAPPTVKRCSPDAGSGSEREMASEERAASSEERAAPSEERAASSGEHRA